MAALSSTPCGFKVPILQVLCMFNEFSVLSRYSMSLTESASDLLVWNPLKKQNKLQLNITVAVESSSLQEISPLWILTLMASVALLHA